MKGIFTSTRSLACWAAFAVALIAAHSASAAFQITITAAGGSSGSLIIEDNNPSFPGPGIGFDSNVNLGEITFIGSVGGYQLIVTATQDAPSGTNGVGTLNVNVLSIRSTNVTGTLTIVATTDPYTFLVGQPGLGANARRGQQIDEHKHDVEQGKRPARSRHHRKHDHRHKARDQPPHGDPVAARVGVGVQADDRPEYVRQMPARDPDAGERKAKERDLANLNREFQRQSREFREDLNLRRNEELGAIQEKARKAILEIARAEKFDLIVEQAVYFNPKIDITDRVMKELGDK